MINEIFKSEKYLKTKETLFKTLEKGLKPLLEEKNNIHQDIYNGIKEDIKFLGLTIETLEEVISRASLKDEDFNKKIGVVMRSIRRDFGLKSFDFKK